MNTISPLAASARFPAPSPLLPFDSVPLFGENRLWRSHGTRYGVALLDGEVSVGNLTLPIGPHEIVFRNPELGEQRQAVTVTLKAPARVSVDLRKKQ